MSKGKLSDADRDSLELSGEPSGKEHTPQQQGYKCLVEHL